MSCTSAMAVLSIDLPGYERDDINVHWQDGVLVVEARHKAENPNRSREAIKRYRVGIDIDPEGIQGRYRQGVLDVFLPPRDAGSTGTTIPVED